MRQTTDKWVLHTVLHFVAVIIQCLVIYIHNRFIYIPYSMPKQIHSDHRHGILLHIAFFHHIFLCIILSGEITAKAQCFCIEPCFLQLYQYQPYAAIVFLHPCSKIYTKHRNIVACNIRMLMPTHFNTNDFFLQQCRKYSLGDSLVFHKEFENGVIYWICNRIIVHNRIFIFQLLN